MRPLAPWFSTFFISECDSIALEPRTDRTRSGMDSLTSLRASRNIARNGTLYIQFML